jgi:HAD superfamily hydrolase (TIGR01509 family)
MDGTLLDTERLARACFERAMEEIGWEVDRSIYDRCVGSTHEATKSLLIEGYGPDFPYDALQESWTAHYHGHIHSRPVDIKPGIVELLDHLGELGIPLAVATSSHRAAVETKLELARIDHHFEFTVCGGETARGKPNPDPYLKATRDLGLEPERAWAIEDSDNGVWAAHRAGLTVFQIPDELEPSEEVKSLGHAILESAQQLFERLK